MVREGKGVSAESGGSKGEKKSTKGVGNTQLRSSLTPIFKMFSSIELEEKHKIQLRKTPFWLLIEAFLEGRVDSKHSKNHNEDAIEVAKTYVGKLDGFKIGKKTVVPFMESDIECIFGLVSGEKEIDIPKREGKPVGSQFFARRLANVPKLDNKNLREQLDVALAGKSIVDDEDVARIICLLLFVNIFFTTTGTSMKWGYVQLVEDVEGMGDYAWCKLIKKNLLESVKKNGNKPEKISGCTMALQYWLCLHSTICEIRKPDEYPMFLQYNTFELHAALSDKLKRFPLPESSILPDEKQRHPRLVEWLQKRERRIVPHVSCCFVKEKEVEEVKESGTENEEVNEEGCEKEEKNENEEVHVNGNENEEVKEDGCVDEDLKENEEVMEEGCAHENQEEDEYDQNYDFEQTCDDGGRSFGGEKRERVDGIVEKELERMTKKIRLLELEKDELREEVEILRGENEKLEDEFLVLKKKIEVGEENSKKLIEKDLEIAELYKRLKEVEDENQRLTEDLTEMTVQKITQSELFKPSNVDNEKEEQNEERKQRSMVRRVKEKSRKRKEDPIFEYPTLKMATRSKTTQFFEKEDDDFVPVPSKKLKIKGPTVNEKTVTAAIVVDELQTTKAKVKPRWILDEKKDIVVGLLDNEDKIKINQMQDHLGHSAIAWSGEDHLSLVSFEDIKAIIKEKELTNMVLDSYIECLRHEQDKHGLDIKERVYMFTSNILYYLETRGYEKFKEKFFESKVKESLQYKKIVIPILTRSGAGGRTQNHWTVVVMDTATFTWSHYNSLAPRGKRVDPYFKGAEKIKKAFEKVAGKSCGNFVETKCPQQTPGTVDCGVVVSYIIAQICTDGTICESMSIEDCRLIRVGLVQKFLYDTGRSWSEEEHLTSLAIESIPDNQ